MNKEVHEDDLALSKNHGKSIKYRRRLAEEREAKELYEDGLSELGEEYQGCKPQK